MKKRSRLLLATAMLLVFSLTILSPVFADTNGDSGMSTRLLLGFTGFSVLYGQLIQHYSPIAKWNKEIEQLTEDQHFMENWMRLNTDPAAVQRAQELIEQNEQEKTVIKKKMSRFKKWFYPVATIVGTAGIFVIESLIRGASD